MASGFLNMLSYWFFFCSSIVMLFSLFIESGAASAGWTIYPPLSDTPYQMGAAVDLSILSLHIAGFSSLMGSFFSSPIPLVDILAVSMPFNETPVWGGPEAAVFCSTISFSNCVAPIWGAPYGGRAIKGAYSFKDIFGIKAILPLAAFWRRATTGHLPVYPLGIHVSFYLLENRIGI